jgi:small subunit ribosomal protein S6e
MPTRIVISEPKTRKAYQIEKDAPALLGTKIGDTFDGSVIGLDGFTLKIMGGSDKEGFPMRIEIPGPGRKKVLLSGPPGFKPWHDGMRKRKLVRGNTISDAIMQINCKVISGEGDIPTILGIQPKEKKEAAPAKG